MTLYQAIAGEIWGEREQWNGPIRDTQKEAIADLEGAGYDVSELMPSVYGILYDNHRNICIAVVKV